MFSASMLLRRELSERNRAFAKKYGLPCQESYGQCPVVAYEPDFVKKVHGNFQPSSYKAMLAEEEWNRRFRKVHSQQKALPPASHGKWRELDSSNSSDALLMNVFCYPGTLQRRSVLLLLGLEGPCTRQFGFKARVPLANGRTDQTEVDLRIDDLLIEAKLTEGGFQTKPKHVVEGYRDFNLIFEPKLLGQTGHKYGSYQLIRNVLAAHASGSRLCVMLDARRPDLAEAWHVVQRAVKPAELRVRCTILTWQELAATLPRTLAAFLAEKYGIVAAL
jgi:hypothetical protein